MARKGKRQKCQHPGCDKHPSFNDPVEIKGLYCNQHKKEGMIDVISKRCQHPSCIKQPSFNLPGEIKGLYCHQHKKDGMTDVKNKKCQHSGCYTQPSFNLPGEIKGVYCRQHKIEGMTDVIHKRKRPRVIEDNSFEKVYKIQSLPEDTYRTKHPRITYILNTEIEPEILRFEF